MVKFFFLNKMNEINIINIMYQDLDIIPILEFKAEKFALKERMLFAPLIEAGEIYASNNKLIVCGNAANSLILNDESLITFDSFQYDFLSDNLVASARGLTDAIYKLGNPLGYHVNMATMVPDYLIHVRLDDRILFTVTSLQSRSLRMSNLIYPIMRPARFAIVEDNSNGKPKGKPIMLACADSGYQLTEIYNTLTNPALVSVWKEKLGTEMELRKIYMSTIRKSINELDKKGGAIIDNSEVGAISTGGAINNIDKLINLLKNNYAKGPGKVIIGSTGIRLLTGESTIPRLDVITDEDLEKDVIFITKLADSLGMELKCKINNPRLPSKPMLRRLVVQCNHMNIINVYNSAKFDLIPYILIDGFAVGSPMILMMYTLIDMWIVQILFHTNSLNTAISKMLLQKLLDDYQKLNDYKTTPEKTFPKSFIGRLEDSRLIFKREAQIRNMERIHFPYMPAAKELAMEKNEQL